MNRAFHYLRGQGRKKPAGPGCMIILSGRGKSQKKKRGRVSLRRNPNQMTASGQIRVYPCHWQRAAAYFLWKE